MELTVASWERKGSVFDQLLIRTFRIFPSTGYRLKPKNSYTSYLASAVPYALSKATNETQPASVILLQQILSFPEYSSSPVFQMSRSSLRDPPTPTTGYTGLEEASPPVQSSASLIKAIREELQRLSQKQPAVASYHS